MKLKEKTVYYSLFKSVTSRVKNHGGLQLKKDFKQMLVD